MGCLCFTVFVKKNLEQFYLPGIKWSSIKELYENHMAVLLGFSPGKRCLWLTGLMYVPTYSLKHLFAFKLKLLHNYCLFNKSPYSIFFQILFSAVNSFVMLETGRGGMEKVSLSTVLGIYDVTIEWNRFVIYLYNIALSLDV